MAPMWFRRRGIPGPGADPPFTVVSRRADATSAGYFTPLAEVAFGRGLSSSGLLRVLSSAEAKTLLAVLSLVTANGRVSAPVGQVARALGVPSPVALARLVSLSRRRWRGRQVIFRVDGGGGLSAYVPSPEIAGQRLGPLERDMDATIITSAGRDAVVQSSRERHGRPRAEVEAEIDSENGGMLMEERVAAAAASRETEPSLEAGERHVRERLVKHGVSHRFADTLVRKHGRDKVARQIAYLPYRKGVKNLAKMLVSSIEDGYDAPPDFPM